MNVTYPKVFARILVVEDEPELRESLIEYLIMEGIDAHGVKRLADAQAWMVANAFDILILDLGLPDGDGLQWLQKHQDMRNKGIIIMTARSEALTRVSGIRAGADVYLVKPVLPEEIISHIHNLMRRLQGQANSTWLIDTVGWRLVTPDARSIKLTHSERILLCQLAHSPGHVVTREVLATSLGNNPEHYDFRRLEVMVRRLRIKSEQAFGVSLPVETAYRQGYAFTANIQIQRDST
jgi:DNA-binding response OmpR family regulator